MKGTLLNDRYALARDHAKALRSGAGTVASAPEAEALFRSMAAYAGTYTIKGDPSPRRVVERDVDGHRSNS